MSDSVFACAPVCATNIFSMRLNLCAILIYKRASIFYCCFYPIYIYRRSSFYFFSNFFPLQKYVHELYKIYCVECCVLASARVDAYIIHYRQHQHHQHHQQIHIVHRKIELLERQLNWHCLEDPFIMALVKLL